MRKEKNSLIKRAALFAGQIAAAAVLFLAIEILFIDGMFLTGVPDIDDVERVTVEYPGVSEQTVDTADRENIELAVKLTGFLRYSVFRRDGGSGEPLITITYYLSDGRQLEVAANEETVWWKGRARSLKDGGTFVNLAEGIFFSK